MIGKERGAVGTTEIMQYPTGANGGTQPLGRRTWVGLTDEELQPIADEYRILFGSWVEDFARAIEAKLKEKNNGKAE